MGCDSDLPDGKEIVMPNGERRKRCPRSGSHSVHRYITAHGWHDKGGLSHIFPPDDTPYSMIEAFNIINSTNNEIDEWRRSKSYMSRAASKIAIKVDVDSKDLDKLSTKFAKQKEDIKKLSAAFKEAKSSIQAMGKENAALVSKVDKLEAHFSKLQAEVQKLVGENKRLQQSSERATDALRRAGKAAKMAGKDADGAAGRVDSLKDAFNGARGKIMDFLLVKHTINMVTDVFNGMFDSIRDGAKHISMFDVLTRSVENFAGKMEEAREATAGTISDRQLVKSAALMNSFGLDMSRLGEIMSTVSKAAIVTGQDMGFMLDSFARGVSRTSVPILDNLGIQISLREAYERFAISVGKTTAEMTKAEQVTATMNEALRMLKETTKDVDLENSKSTVWERFAVMLENGALAIEMAVVKADDTLRQWARLIEHNRKMEDDPLYLEREKLISGMADALKVMARGQAEVELSARGVTEGTSGYAAAVDALTGKIMASQTASRLYKEVVGELAAKNEAISKGEIDKNAALGETYSSLNAIAGLMAGKYAQAIADATVAERALNEDIKARVSDLSDLEYALKLQADLLNGVSLSQINVAAATARLSTAEGEYADAVEKGGKNSAEALEAHERLVVAMMDLNDAQSWAKSSTMDLGKALSGTTGEMQQLASTAQIMLDTYSMLWGAEKAKVEIEGEHGRKLREINDFYRDRIDILKAKKGVEGELAAATEVAAEAEREYAEAVKNAGVGSDEAAVALDNLNRALMAVSLSQTDVNLTMGKFESIIKTLDVSTRNYFDSLRAVMQLTGAKDLDPYKVTLPKKRGAGRGRGRGDRAEKREKFKGPEPVKKFPLLIDDDMLADSARDMVATINAVVDEYGKSGDALGPEEVYAFMDPDNIREVQSRLYAMISEKQKELDSLLRAENADQYKVQTDALQVLIDKLGDMSAAYSDAADRGQRFKEMLFDGADAVNAISSDLSGFEAQTAGVSEAMAKMSQVAGIVAQSMEAMATATNAQDYAQGAISAIGRITSAFIEDEKTKALVMGLMYQAQAIVYMVSEDYVRGAAYATAAKMMFAVAGGAFSSSAASAGAASGPSASSRGPEARTVNVYVNNPMATKAEVGRAVMRALKEAEMSGYNPASPF